MNEEDMQHLKKLVAAFNFNPDDKERARLLEFVKKVDSKGYGHLMKCQCAYEFHMILDSLIDS